MRKLKIVITMVFVQIFRFNVNSIISDRFIANIYELYTWHLGMFQSKKIFDHLLLLREVLVSQGEGTNR